MEENSKRETERIARLSELLPKGRRSVLEIGARDGRVTRILVEYFDHITALDLIAPTFVLSGVSLVAGDVRNLSFADNSFDCVICTEVLEHVDELEQACRELKRVAVHEVVVGVPFSQDLRFGRTKCEACGKSNPPWGHLNSFNKDKLINLFRPFRLQRFEYVGQVRDRTNFISAALMDVADNPWGTYVQEEPCIFCGSKLRGNKDIPLWKHVCCAFAGRLTDLQNMLSKPQPAWMHAVFSREQY